MGEAIETPAETGKTYALARWLPAVRVSGRPRPQTAVWEDGITIGLTVFSLVALFWDGLRHNNLTGQDTFWSDAHIAMYSGLTLLGAWIAYVLIRRQDDVRHPDFSAVPLGYGLAIIALPLAAIAGPADGIWHSAYGFENQIDSAYSPPHQGLFIAGGLLAAIPFAAAWQRWGSTASLRALFPAILSVTAVVAVGLFITHQLVPFYAGVSTTAAFQEDIEGRADAFSPGADAVHEEGLSTALTNYGDDAFPYYFYSTHHTVGGMLLFTAALLGGILLARRRWRLPFGSLTIICTFQALLWPMLSEYRQAELIPALVLTGLVGDLLLARLAGADGPVRVGAVRLFALVLPIVLWGLFFLCVELFQGGLGWEPTLWFGVLVTSGALGYALSLLVFQPFSRVAEEPPPAPAS